jgi:Tol biopolymer transport system component
MDAKVSKISEYRQAKSDGRLAFQLWEVVHEGEGDQICSALYINVCTIEANGQNRQQLTFRPGHYCSPSFSPDGTKIAFSAGRDQIYLMNADGTEPRPISGDLSGCDFPCFSPDGQRIAFIARGEGGWAIFVMSVDGTDPRQITKNSVPRNPVFTTDGCSIIYDSLGLYIVDVDGGEPRPLSKQSFENILANVAVSPDGTKIAFVEQIEYYPEPDEYAHLYTVFTSKLDGAGLTKITGNLLSASSPAFSPDGHRIAVVGQMSEGENPSIYSTKLDGSDLEIIAENAVGVSHLSWAPIANSKVRITFSF